MYVLHSIDLLFIYLYSYIVLYYIEMITKSYIYEAPLYIVCIHFNYTVNDIIIIK